MCGEAEKEHLLRRVATTLSSRQEVQQRQTYVIIKSEKQHLSPSAQNKRAPRTSLVKVKKLRIVRSPSTRLQLKESMHQDFELLKKKKYLQIYESQHVRKPPPFSCVGSLGFT